jgi:NAD(P)-dependent dehydrogenase (short-subunit alcohol dehydrogenase family)
MTAGRSLGLVTAAMGIGPPVPDGSPPRLHSVLLARSPEIEETADALGGVGVAGSFAVAEDLQRYVTTALERFGRIDAVIANTAGHPARAELLELSDSAWMGFRYMARPSLGQ